jgi:hypothetical protein
MPPGSFSEKPLRKVGSLERRYQYLVLKKALSVPP